MIAASLRVGKRTLPSLMEYRHSTDTSPLPDSPNQAPFPSTILELGREWTSTTVYRFGANTNEDYRD
jgi:hypothetical protein